MGSFPRPTRIPDHHLHRQALPLRFGWPILQLVDQGMSNKQIARQLGIEVATAKNHVHNILGKLHVHRRIEASDWYRQAGFHLKLQA